MIKVALKYGDPVEEIIGHLSNIDCEHVIIGKSSSIADGISRALKDLPKNEVVIE